MIRLAVRCRAEAAEAVLPALLELSPNGVEEQEGGSWVEYTVYGPAGEVPELGWLQAAVGDGLVEVTSTEIPDDWADRWRDFHRAVAIDDRLCVRPAWDEAGGEGVEVDVVVDPGQAFGTGAHPTTRMCLELLLELAGRGEAAGALTDLGTGTGVLAIAAAKLGWRPVAGVDHERAALDAAAANAKANGVKLELARVNLREEVPELAPTVAANLTAPLLVDFAQRLREPPRWLVASGMLQAEVGQVKEAFGACGLRGVARRDSGDWAALLVAGRVDRGIRGQLDQGRG